MKKILSVVGMLAVSTLVGCNHVDHIGSIGPTEYHAVRTTDISGPNAVVIVAVDENGIQTVASFGTSGILPSAIGAGGAVGAAEVADADTTNVSIRSKHQPLTRP